MKRYRSSARHIERSLGRWRIDELTVGRVNKLMRELSDRATAARNAKILLSEMTELAHAERALASDPMLGAITPKMARKDAEDIVIVRPQEATEIFHAIANYRQGPGVPGRRLDGQLLDLFQLQAGSGLRIGEALALRRSSVLPPTARQQEWRVNVVATIVDARGEAKHQDGKLKTSSSARNIPVTGWAGLGWAGLGWAEKPLQRRLAATSGASADSPLFPSARGTWRSPNKFDSQWRAILKAHPELPRITSHAWRRTIATAVEEVSERYARKLLGHKVARAGEDETLHKHYVRRGRFVELDKRAMKAIRRATIERPAKEQAASWYQDAIQKPVRANALRPSGVSLGITPCHGASTAISHLFCIRRDPGPGNRTPPDRNPRSGGVICSPTWTRTKNLSVNSRLLCQLSYGGSLRVRQRRQS